MSDTMMSDIDSDSDSESENEHQTRYEQQQGVLGSLTHNLLVSEDQRSTMGKRLAEQESQYKDLQQICRDNLAEISFFRRALEGEKTSVRRLGVTISKGNERNMAQGWEIEALKCERRILLEEIYTADASLRWGIKFAFQTYATDVYMIKDLVNIVLEYL